MNSVKRDVCKLVLGSAAAAIALASLPAGAVDWNTVASTPSQTVLVDRDSVHSFNGDVRAWVVHSYNQVESLGDMFHHRSKVMLYSFACEQRQLGYIQWSMQSGEFGGGQTIWADRIGDVTHYPADQDIADNALVDSVCARYAQNSGKTVTATR